MRASTSAVNMRVTSTCSNIQHSASAEDQASLGKLSHDLKVHACDILYSSDKLPHRDKILVLALNFFACSFLLSWPTRAMPYGNYFKAMHTEHVVGHK